MPDTPIIKPLLLCGGKSSRMGSPKHLLEMPDGRPLYQHLVNILQSACPEAPKIYISLAQDSPADEYLRDSSALVNNTAEKNIQVILDTDLNTGQESAGPAAGLLAAHQHSPNSTWLVIACDYPFITKRSLQQLLSMYQPPVTCFINSEGFSEPLVAIWSPQALSQLAINCASGSKGPSRVIRQLKGLQLKPEEEEAEAVLFNANTREEWDAALSRLKDT